MITCSNCGAKLPKQATFCGNCGAQLVAQSKNSLKFKDRLKQIFKQKKYRYPLIAIIIIAYTLLVSGWSSDNTDYWTDEFKDSTLQLAIKDDNGYVKHLYLRVHPSTKSVYLVDNKTDASNGVFYKGLNSNYSFAGDTLQISESKGSENLIIYLKDLDNSGDNYSAQAQVIGNIDGIANNATFSNNTYQSVTLKKID